MHVAIKLTVRFPWMKPTFLTRWVRLALRFFWVRLHVFICFHVCLVFIHFLGVQDVRERERERQSATVCQRLIDVCLLKEKSTTNSLWYLPRLCYKMFFWVNMSKMVDHNGLLQNDQNTFVVKIFAIPGLQKCWIQHTMAPLQTHL